MKRTPEPEVMDGVEQSEAYAHADFEAVNSAFVARLLDTFSDLRDASVLDLGCGPGDILIKLALTRPDLAITGVDASEPMLALGRVDAAARGVDARLRFVQAWLPSLGPIAAERFDAVISNSLLHHLHEPQVLWRTIHAAAAPNAPVFIVDLLRPDDEARARAIVDEHAEGEPEILRRDFYLSLCASFTLNEVRDQLTAAGLSHLSVSQISDIHLCISGHR